MSVGISLQKVMEASERDGKCIENGGHFYSGWGKWHMRHYKHYPSKPITGKPYWIRFRVCSRCKSREVQQKWEKPMEGEIDY